MGVEAESSPAQPEEPSPAALLVYRHPPLRSWGRRAALGKWCSVSGPERTGLLNRPGSSEGPCPALGPRTRDPESLPTAHGPPLCGQDLTASPLHLGGLHPGPTQPPPCGHWITPLGSTHTAFAVGHLPASCGRSALLDHSSGLLGFSF